MNTLPSFRVPGKLAKTQSINEIITYLASNQNFSELTHPEEEAIKGIRLLVQVSPEGPAAEADFDDNMYWGRILYIKTPPTGMATDVLKVWEDVPEVDGMIIPFTCLAEHGGVFIDHTVVGDETKPLAYAGPHAIPIGAICEIFPRIDVSGKLRWVSFTIPRQMVMLRPTAAASGGGKYLAFEQIPASEDILETGNATAGELSTDGPEEVILINPSEYDLGTHTLPLGTSVFAAYYVRTNTDGQRVYLLAGGGGGGEGNPQYQGQLHIGVADGVKGWAFMPLGGIPLA